MELIICIGGIILWVVIWIIIPLVICCAYFKEPAGDRLSTHVDDACTKNSSKHPEAK